MLWEDAVIPVAVEGCGMDVDGSQFVVGDFDFKRIRFGVEFGLDPKTLGCHGACDQVDNHGGASSVCDGWG